MADIDKFAKQGVLRILVGNKCDLEHQRAVNKECANEIAEKYGIKYIETSAKETVNIEQLFINTAKYLLSKQTSIQKKRKSIGNNSYGIDISSNGDNYNNTNNKSKSMCC